MRRRLLSVLRPKHSSRSPSPNSESQGLPTPIARPISAPPSIAPEPRAPPPAAADNIQEIRSRVWNDAYDKTKEDEPRIVEAYEKVLSAQLRAGECVPSADGNSTNVIGQDAQARKAQMKELVDRGLEKAEKEAKIKETIKDGMQPIKNVKEFVSVAVKAEPSAAVAWVGITTCLEIITNPVSEPGINREGIKYVLERIEWHWKLAELLLDTGRVDPSIGALQRLLERHIVKLYKKLLLYQMQSVCLYNRHWAAVIVRDLFKVDDWQDKLDSIRRTEDAIRHDVDQHNAEILKSRLQSIDGTLGHLRLDVKAVESAVKDQTNLLRQMHHGEKDQKCLQDLYVVNPEMHKKDIEKTKGGLLKDSYRWILDNGDFKKFWSDPESRLLWVKGDPGKGKTMLLCGIIDELESKSSHPISYFFCQATQEQLRSATSVLRGLLWLLCVKNSMPTWYIRERYDMEGRKPFEDVSALEDILGRMLEDPPLHDAVFVVDGLDECTDNGREELIGLIIRFSSFFRAKWIVSSRNWPVIEEQLLAAQKVRVSLELNKDSISQAVEIFIRHKVDQLAVSKRYDQRTREAVLERLLLKANDTFLWVALVCKELGRPQVKTWRTIEKLDSVPAGLNGLYGRMLEQVFTSDEAAFCRQILATACIAYRPVSLDELRVFVPDLRRFSNRVLEDIVGECGSFLTLQEDIVYFVHQSAQDFLLDKAHDRIFPSSIPGQHHLMFRRSMDALRGLRRNAYGLKSPGVWIHEISKPEPDPLSGLEYSCLYWAEHLEHFKEARDPSDDGVIDKFIKERFLYWLEALSLQRKMPEGAEIVRKLGDIMQDTAVQGLKDLVEDAHRFILSHKPLIELTPLQVYASALVFSPSGSLVKQLYKKEEPAWMELKPKPEANWNACIQTIDVGDGVFSIAFSPDERLLASGTSGGDIKIWDVASSHCIRALKADASVRTVAFLQDSRRLAVRLGNGAVELWDTVSSLCLQRLLGNEIGVCESAFSPDGKMLASGSEYGVVKLWDLDTGEPDTVRDDTQTHITSLCFSRDSKQLASGANDHLVHVWDTATGRVVWKLEGHGALVSSLAFLPGNLLASGTSLIKIWDLSTGDCLQTIDGRGPVHAIASLEDGQRLVCGSDHGRIQVFDDKGEHVQVLKGHDGHVSSLAFSAGRQLLASGSFDKTVKLWDLTSQTAEVDKDHSGQVAKVVFSSDGRLLASSSPDGTIKLWDTSDGSCVHTLTHDQQNFALTSLNFSPNGKYLLAYAYSKLATLWDTAEGKCIKTFEEVREMVFSPDSQRLALSIVNANIGIWDMASQTHVMDLNRGGHALTFISDRFLAFATNSQVAVADVDSREYRYAVTVGYYARGMAMSKNSERVARAGPSGISVRDVKTGKIIHDLPAISRILAFSPDGKWLASTSQWDVLIWDLDTGACTQRIKSATFLKVLRFDTSNRFRLHTDMGVLNLDVVVPPRVEDVNTPQEAHYCGYGWSSDGNWILKGSERVLWLPQEYRAKLAIAGSDVGIGCKSGRVVLMRFE
ncbi:hypothetical protein ACJ41O_012744 [Fusarium nematophilum]